LALYAVITYMDSVEGVFVPRGGMHAMASGLAAAVVDAGAEIRYGVPVTRILRRGDGTVTGVELDGSERVAADAVVCNADLPVAYRTLLGGIDAPRAARRGKYSPSCLLWVAGVRGLPPEGAAHHNIHFGAQWDDAFKTLIKRGLRMPDPSVLVTLHSLDDPTLAPPDCTTLYALEPVPNLDGRIDWSREGERFAGDLKRQVAQLGYPTDVVVERVYDPLDWEAPRPSRAYPMRVPAPLSRAASALRKLFGRSTMASIRRLRRSEAARNGPATPLSERAINSSNHGPPRSSASSPGRIMPKICASGSAPRRAR
jgi:phytoene desaturase